METQQVNQILRRYKSDPTDIIAILQDVQQTFRYLPEDVLVHIAGKLDIPQSHIFHLATFFRAFSLEKRGKHEIHVCMGTACHVRGAPRILEALERGLGIKAGGTTKDLSCTLETVNCVGACALGPVILADDQSVGKMNPLKTERVLKQMGLAAGNGKKAPASTGKKKAKAATKPVKKKVAPAAKGKKKAAPMKRVKAVGSKKKAGAAKRKTRK